MHTMNYDANFEQVDDEANALQFSQIFVLVPENESYIMYVIC